MSTKYGEQSGIDNKMTRNKSDKTRQATGPIENQWSSHRYKYAGKATYKHASTAFNKTRFFHGLASLFSFGDARRRSIDEVE